MDKLNEELKASDLQRTTEEARRLQRFMRKIWASDGSEGFCFGRGVGWALGIQLWNEFWYDSSSGRFQRVLLKPQSINYTPSWLMDTSLYHEMSWVYESLVCQCSWLISIVTDCIQDKPVVVFFSPKKKSPHAFFVLKPSKPRVRRIEELRKERASIKAVRFDAMKSLVQKQTFQLVGFLTVLGNWGRSWIFTGFEEVRIASSDFWFGLFSINLLITRNTRYHQLLRVLLVNEKDIICFVLSKSDLLLF